MRLSHSNGEKKVFVNNPYLLNLSQQPGLIPFLQNPFFQPVPNFSPQNLPSPIQENAPQEKVLQLVDEVKTEFGEKVSKLEKTITQQVNLISQLYNEMRRIKKNGTDRRQNNEQGSEEGSQNQESANEELQSTGNRRGNQGIRSRGQRGSQRGSRGQRRR